MNVLINVIDPWKGNCRNMDNIYLIKPRGNESTKV